MGTPYGDIASRLQTVIRASGMTQTEFARSIGVKPNNVTNWLSGNYRVGLDAALSIRAAYGVPIDWLYCGGSVDKLPASVSRLLIESPRVTHSQ